MTEPENTTVDQAPKLPVDGGPDKPLPRKFSNTHEANFQPGAEKPQGEGGLILNHIATANAEQSVRS